MRASVDVACSLVLTILLLAGSAFAKEPPANLDQVQPATGPAFSGKLTNASADGTLQFTLAGQPEPRSLKLADLVRWGEWRKVLPGARVVLQDGSFVVADVIELTATHLTIDSINGLGEIKLPRGAVRAIVLQPARWREGTQTPLKEDAAPDSIPLSTLVLANGDRRAGTLAGWENGSLTWQTGEQTLRVPLGSVIAVEFRSTPVSGDAPAERVSEKSSKANSWLGFKDGSRVRATQFQRDKQVWQIKLAAGGQIAAELDSLVALQPVNRSPSTGERIVYLSDLPPAGYKSIPWLTTTWDYQRDRNVTGGELRVGGLLALKGLGMHSASRLTYDLDKQYTHFATRVGIDDSTAGRGHALARVYGDRGDGKWELLAESPALRAGAPAVPLEADLTGMQRLALVVDFAGDGDAGDHVDWLDARVMQ